MNYGKSLISLWVILLALVGQIHLSFAQVPFISGDSVSGSEGDDLVFKVRLSHAAAEDVSARYKTEERSSQEGEDYLLTEGTVVFPAGSTEQEIRVATLPDEEVEGNESFEVKFFGPVNCRLGFDWTTDQTFFAPPESSEMGLEAKVHGGWLAVSSNSKDSVEGAEASVLLYEELDGRFLFRKKLAPNEEGTRMFGSVFDLSDDYLIVGDPGYSDETASLRGACYVYLRHEGGENNWGQVARILGDPHSFERFTENGIAIDGDRFVTTEDRGSGAAPDQAKITIFKTTNGGLTWNEQHEIIANDSEIISFKDGKIVTKRGRSTSGFLRVFSEEGGAWLDSGGWDTQVYSASYFQDRLAVGESPLSGMWEDGGRVFLLTCADNNLESVWEYQNEEPSDSKEWLGVQTALSADWLLTSIPNKNIPGQAQEGEIAIFKFDQGTGELVKQAPWQAADASIVDLAGFALDGDVAVAGIRSSGRSGDSDGIVVLRPNRLTGTIHDTNSPGIEIADCELHEPAEGSTVCELQVSLTQPPTEELTVDYATRDGSANQALDYLATSGTLKFEPGQSVARISIAILADALPESREDFFLDLTNPSAGTILGEGTVSILAPKPSLPKLELGSIKVVEGGENEVQQALIPLTLDTPADGLIELAYETLESSATSGIDFGPSSGTVRFEPGQVEATLSITVYGDRFGEFAEDLSVVFPKSSFIEYSGMPHEVFSKSFGIGSQFSVAEGLLALPTNDRTDETTPDWWIDLYRDSGENAWSLAQTLLPPEMYPLSRLVFVDLTETCLVAGVAVGGNNMKFYFYAPTGPDGSWVLDSSITGVDNFFGYNSGTLSSNTFVAGSSCSNWVAHEGGAAWVYGRDESGEWVERAILTAPEGEADLRFGKKVVIDEPWIAVASNPFGISRPRVYLFQRDAGGPDKWGLLQRLDFDETLEVEWEFRGPALGIDAERGLVAIGGRTAENEGLLLIHQRDAGGGDQWGEIARIVEPEADVRWLSIKDGVMLSYWEGPGLLQQHRIEDSGELTRQGAREIPCESDFDGDFRTMTALCLKGEGSIKVFSNNAAGVQILNDEPEPFFEILADEPVVGEGEGRATVTVRRLHSEQDVDPVTLRIRTLDGTARSGTDFEPILTTHEFSDNSFQRRINVTANADTSFEGIEFFYLSVDQPPVGSLVNDRVKIEIADDTVHAESQGFPMVQDGDRASYLVPLDDSLGTRWKDFAFIDTEWAEGDLPIGYEASGLDYAELIATNIQEQMHNKSTSVYFRVPFLVEDRDLVPALNLRMRYDDGFVAYLNGMEIARASLTDQEPAWNSDADRFRPDDLAVGIANFPVPGEVAVRQGLNILAIHGVNDHVGSSDLLMGPELHVAVENPYFGYWAGKAGLDLTNMGPDEDPDRDGLSNLMEFALDQNPLVITQPIINHIVSETGQKLEFIVRDTSFHGLNYYLERSSDLAEGNWQVVASRLGGLTWQGALEAPGAELLKVSVDLPPLGSSSSLYHRLRVELTEP